MKKIILLIYILCLSTFSYTYVFEGKGGFSLSNSYDLDSLGSSSGQFTIKFAGELWQEASANTELGIGVGMLLLGNASSDPVDGGNMNLFTAYPIYGGAKYSFDQTIFGFTPYGKFLVGVSINDVGTYGYLYESNEGLYIAMGAGGQKDALTFEVLFETTRSQLNFVTDPIEEDGNSFPYSSLDVTNTLISLTVGYQFEFN